MPDPTLDDYPAKENIATVDVPDDGIVTVIPSDPYWKDSSVSPEDAQAPAPSGRLPTVSDADGDTLTFIDAWIELIVFADDSEDYLGPDDPFARPGWLSKLMHQAIGTDGGTDALLKTVWDTGQMHSNLQLYVVGLTVSDGINPEVTDYFRLYNVGVVPIISPVTIAYCDGNDVNFVARSGPSAGELRTENLNLNRFLRWNVDLQRFISSDGTEIVTFASDLTDRQVVYDTGGGLVEGVDRDDETGRFYFVNSSDRDVYYVESDGTNLTQLTSEPNNRRYSFDLVIDNGVVYATGYDFITKMSLTGSGVTTIFDGGGSGGNDAVLGLNVWAEQDLLVFNTQNRNFNRIALDGTGLTLLIGGGAGATFDKVTEQLVGIGYIGGSHQYFEMDLDGGNLNTLGPVDTMNTPAAATPIFSDLIP